MNLLNIVVPTRNRSDFIVPLIRSWSTLSEYDDIRLTIIDDASAIQHRRALSRLYEQLPVFNCIFLLHNLGASAARNIGMNTNQSRWVWFFDDDDYISAHQLTAVANALRRESRYWVLLSKRTETAKGCTVTTPQGDGLFSRFSKQGHQVNTSCAIFRRELLVSVGAWDEELIAGQDTDLFLRVSEVSDAAVFRDVSVLVREHEKPRITSAWRTQIVAKVQFLRKNWYRLHWQRRCRYIVSLMVLTPLLKHLVRKFMTPTHRLR